MFLHKKSITSLMDNGQLIIRPLLEKNQIGELTIDLRLGYDFLVSIQGKGAYINGSLNNEDIYPIGYFFQETRKMIGETFLLHPNQTVLASSLEYIKLPNNVFAVLNMRSSYLRLGLSISAIVQPGYCGCFSLELTNTNKNPINLTVGATLFQARLYEIEEDVNYFHTSRKYICQVRPKISAITNDPDLKVLNTIWKSANNIAP